jgi:uncharacterized membrane protein (GlpM family)
MMSSVLIAKLIAGPLIIAATSLAGQRWGQHIAGLLAGLPSLALLIVGVIWFEQGATFAYQVIDYAPIGLIANAVYMLLLAYLSRFLTWPYALLAALAGYFISAMCLANFAVAQIHYMGIFAVFFLAIAYKAIPQVAHQNSSKPRPKTELLARMLLAALLIITLSTAAPALGVGFSGIFAGFPVAGLILPAFTLSLSGRAALLNQLKGFLLGLMGFAICFLLWPLGIAQLGFAALLPALLAAILCSASLHFLVQRSLFPARL